MADIAYLAYPVAAIRTMPPSLLGEIWRGPCHYCKAEVFCHSGTRDDAIASGNNVTMVCVDCIGGVKAAMQAAGRPTGVITVRNERVSRHFNQG